MVTKQAMIEVKWTAHGEPHQDLQVVTVPKATPLSQIQQDVLHHLQEHAPEYHHTVTVSTIDDHLPPAG